MEFFPPLLWSIHWRVSDSSMFDTVWGKNQLSKPIVHEVLLNPNIAKEMALKWKFVSYYVSTAINCYFSFIFMLLLYVITDLYVLYIFANFSFPQLNKV